MAACFVTSMTGVAEAWTCIDSEPFESGLQDVPCLLCGVLDIVTHPHGQILVWVVNAWGMLLRGGAGVQDAPKEHAI